MINYIRLELLQRAFVCIQILTDIHICIKFQHIISTRAILLKLFLGSKNRFETLPETNANANFNAKDVISYRTCVL